MLLVVVAMVVVSAGCSLSTNSADVTIYNTWDDSDWGVVNGSGKLIPAGGSTTWTVDWNGLGDEDVLMEVYDTSSSSAPLATTETTVMDGDSKSYYY